jgi:hypothetical protein
MKCRDCRYISEPTTFNPDKYPVVRCTLGLWDKNGIKQWYSFGECVLNRGPVRRHGEACTKGVDKR